MFLWVSGRHFGAHPDGFQNGVSIQISINLGKTFQSISCCELNLGEGLCKFTFFPPRFWTLSVEGFDFYVPLKTSNDDDDDDDDNPYCVVHVRYI